MQSPEVDGVPSLNFWQELRLYFTRRAEGLPDRNVQDEITGWILKGGHSPWPDIDRVVLAEYEAWQRERGETG